MRGRGATPSRLRRGRREVVRGRGAVTVCERSIQVHGGIGFTWEHPLHRYYKRAQWIQSFGGFPAAQRAEIAAALLG